MNTSSARTEAAAKAVTVTDETLVVELRDGRVLSVPVGWYPRLAEASAAERRRWELIGRGVGIHWPAIDEDVSINGLIRGLPSGESAASLDRWRAARRRPANRRSQSAKALRQSGGKGSPRTRLRG